MRWQTAQGQIVVVFGQRQMRQRRWQRHVVERLIELESKRQVRQRWWQHHIVERLIEMIAKVKCGQKIGHQHADTNAARTTFCLLQQQM